MRHLRHPVFLMLVFGLWVWGVDTAMKPPQSLPSWVEDGRFSAGRAELLLYDLLAEDVGAQMGVNHPSGSDANRQVRGRVAGMLESWGYTVEIQSDYHCNPAYGSCSPVDNIIAVHQGAEGKNAVLLTAHYDSGLAGIGAADDGAGTAAVLEVARMVSDLPAYNNDVIFLISDGEERGLIGAHLFAERHPLFGKVKAVVNLEARGVTGPSAMFETGQGNRRIIRKFSEAVARPVANSLTYEIYRRMPNDTDYSVYRDRGVMGLNFAFSGGVAAYHSSRDDLENLDRNSLQHHGDNAWAMVQALGNHNLDAIGSNEDAVYVDFLGMVLWHYPASIAGGVAIFLAVLLVLGIGVWARGHFRIGELFWSLNALLIACVLLPLGGYLLSWPLGQWIDSHPLEHPFPWYGRVTLYLLLLCVIWVAMKLTEGRKSAQAATLVCWVLWSAAAVWLSHNFPAASYLFLVPMFAFFCGMLIDVWRRKRVVKLLFARLFGFVMAAYMAIYHFQMLEVVLNFQYSHIKVLPLLFVILAVLPLLIDEPDELSGGWGPFKVLLGLIVLGCLMQQFTPGYTVDRPRAMSLMYQESAGSQTGHLVLDSLFGEADEDFAWSHGFTAVQLPSFTGRSEEVLAKEMPALGLPAAEIHALTVTEVEGAWHHSAVLTSTAAMEGVRLVIDRSVPVRQIWLDDQIALDTELAKKSAGQGAWMVNLAFPGSQSRRINIVAGTAEAIEISARSRHALPQPLLRSYDAVWPPNTSPAFLGHRAVVLSKTSN